MPDLKLLSYTQEPALKKKVDLYWMAPYGCENPSSYILHFEFTDGIFS
jgi:hypothetical protein